MKLFAVLNFNHVDTDQNQARTARLVHRTIDGKCGSIERIGDSD